MRYAAMVGLIAAIMLAWAMIGSVLLSVAIDAGLDWTALPLAALGTLLGAFLCGQWACGYLNEDSEDE